MLDKCKKSCIFALSNNKKFTTMNKKVKIAGYFLDGENNVFRKLSEAKYHIYIAYTKNERIKYLNEACIVGFDKKDEYRSYTPIKIDDEGGYSFGKTYIEKI